jgi:hypothetical protein
LIGILWSYAVTKYQSFPGLDIALGSALRRRPHTQAEGVSGSGCVAANSSVEKAVISGLPLIEAKEERWERSGLRGMTGV